MIPWKKVKAEPNREWYLQGCLDVLKVIDMPRIDMPEEEAKEFRKWYLMTLEKEENV